MEKGKGKRNLLISSFFLLVLLILLTVSLQPEDEANFYQGTAMSTVIQFQLYGNDKDTLNTKNKIMKILQQLEEKELSWRQEGSFVERINHNRGMEFGSMSEKEKKWISKLHGLSQDTDGAFDYAIGSLVKLWDIEGEHPVVPPYKTIKKAITESGYREVEVTEDGIILGKGVSLDLGAAGKGIACDEVYKYLSENYKNKGGVISIGGSLLVYGKKPKGQWKIGIQDPRNLNGETLGVYEAKNTCYISTSGDYEKYFEANGKRYHHILDESTGYPADNGLISVTIIGDNGCESDALSTACFVMGKEKGMEYARKKNVKAIFVTHKKEVYVVGIKNEFSLTAKGYTMEE